MSGFNNSLMGYESGLQTTVAWQAFIAGGRSKVSRKPANNTVVRMDGADAVIRLHDTDIVRVLAGGGYQLNSGGWRTKTTKERINAYTPARISQRGGVWYMSDGSLFEDNMTIDTDGKPTKPKQPAKYEAKLKVIKKQARDYAKAFVVELQAGRIDYPGSGDCWYCWMFETDYITNTDHIHQHIKEKYYVPSLLVNAGRAAGYRDDQVGLMGIGGRQLFINPEQDIYKYVVKHLQGDI